MMGTGPMLVKLISWNMLAMNLGVIHASAHSKDYQWQKKTQKTATVFIPDVDKKFHSYILEWTPECFKSIMLMTAYILNIKMKAWVNPNGHITNLFI